MFDDPCEAAARLLVAARLARRPGPRLPESCRPRDLDAALAIQQRVSDLLAHPIGGWKCALPTLGKIIVAPVYAPSICTTPHCPEFMNSHVRVEPEIAFVFRHGLPSRDKPYGEAEVRSAIGETCLALEILGCRYEEPQQVSFVELLADGLFNQGLVLGPRVPDGVARHLETMTLSVEAPDSAPSNYAGRHPDGHPLAPVCWLANFLSSRGKELSAGQVVISGSYAGVLELPVATPLRIRFGELGTLNVQFTSAEK